MSPTPSVIASAVKLWKLRSLDHPPISGEQLEMRTEASPKTANPWVHRCPPLRIEIGLKSRCHGCWPGTWKAATFTSLRLRTSTCCTSRSRNPAPLPSSLFPLTLSALQPLSTRLETIQLSVSLDPVVGPPCSLQMQLPPSTVSRVPWFKTSLAVGAAEVLFCIPVSDILKKTYYRLTGRFNPARLTAQEYGSLALAGTS